MGKAPPAGTGTAVGEAGAGPAVAGSGLGERGVLRDRGLVLPRSLP